MICLLPVCLERKNKLINQVKNVFFFFLEIIDNITRGFFWILSLSNQHIAVMSLNQLVCQETYVGNLSMILFCCFLLRIFLYKTISTYIMKLLYYILRSLVEFILVIFVQCLKGFSKCVLICVIRTVWFRSKISYQTLKIICSSFAMKGSFSCTAFAAILWNLELYCKKCWLIWRIFQRVHSIKFDFLIIIKKVLFTPYKKYKKAYVCPFMAKIKFGTIVFCM